MNETTRTYAQLVHKLVYTAYWHETLFGRDVRGLRYSLETLSYEIEGRLVMAKKATGQSQFNKPAYEAVKWVNRMLTEEEKERHDAAKLDPTKTFKGVLAVALQGYNIALKWDGYSNCYQATLIPFNTASGNYGFGLSARAADPHRALSLLLFKHYEVLQEDWQQAYKPTGKNLEG